MIGREYGRIQVSRKDRTVAWSLSAGREEFGRCGMDGFQIGRVGGRRAMFVG